MKVVSVVLPTYTPDTEMEVKLDRFLSSYVDTAYAPIQLQLIVVDNGSPVIHPRLKQMADIYIHKPQPIGYARAANIGMALADGDYIVVANNDLVLLDPSWHVKMMGLYDLFGPGVLCAADVNGARQPFQVLPDTHWYSLWMTDRKTMVKVGYFNEILAYRFQDQDYSIRMKKAGFKVLQAPNILVRHDESSTYNKMKAADPTLQAKEDEERAEMIRRHGYAHFFEWVAVNR